jgi:hypothetical protein
MSSDVGQRPSGIVRSGRASRAVHRAPDGSVKNGERKGIRATNMKTGNRAGPWVELMKQEVAKPSDDDMIALSAYLESLDP